MKPIIMKSVKKLEYDTLEFLNRVQPFEYFNNGIRLPISPYKPALHRYTKFDFYNDYITIELKTRTGTLEDYNGISNDNTLNVHKIISNHSIFMFSYENKTNVLNNLSFINYNHSIFDAFKVSDTRYGQLFVIPQQFITVFEEFVEPQSCRINLDYSTEYIQHHAKLIEHDRFAYITNFGYYNF